MRNVLLERYIAINPDQEFDETTVGMMLRGTDVSINSYIEIKSLIRLMQRKNNVLIECLNEAHQNIIKIKGENR